MCLFGSAFVVMCFQDLSWEMAITKDDTPRGAPIGVTSTWRCRRMIGGTFRKDGSYIAINVKRNSNVLVDKARTRHYPARAPFATTTMEPLFH